MRKHHKYKRDRTLLCNIFNHPKSSYNKRPYKPGMHKGSMYSNTYHGELLFYKQKLLAYYTNIKDYQLKAIVADAIKHRDYKSRIIKTLESRLDVILYRSGCVKSMRAARQIINHRFVYVTMDKKTNVVTSPSFLIKKDCFISFRENIIDTLKLTQTSNIRTVPKHIVFETDEFKLFIQHDYIPANESHIELNNIGLDSIVSYYRF